MDQTINDLYVKKLDLALEQSVTEKLSITLVLEIEDIGAPDFEPPFVKKLIVSHRFATTTLFAGRMELPFGFFATAVVTDPRTKTIGESKTDSGVGLKSNHGEDKQSFDWSAITYTDDYRTAGSGGDGINLNLSWHADRGWKAGAGYISEQRAQSHAPSLGSVFLRVDKDDWLLSGSYITALDSKGGERPRAINLDGAISLTQELKLGTRLQGQLYTIDDNSRIKYEEWAVAFKYTPTKDLTLGLEYFTGRERIGHAINSKVQQFTAQINMTF